MTTTENPRIRLTCPADVLGAVPYLLGFHPADSLVLLGFTGPRGLLRLTTRFDLPVPPGALARFVPLLAREGVGQVVLAGFGPGPLVTPAVTQARALLREAGVLLAEALRAEQGRYWSYLCDEPSCCPPEGVPYDPRSSVIAAEATVSGLVALPDRRALRDSLAPVGGTARQAMRRATARQTAALRESLARSRRPDDFAARFVADGLALVRAAVTACRAGETPDAETAARLGLALAVLRVRDEAWVLIDDETQDAHRRLWGELTRRLEPRFVPPAAALLGMTAWRAGDCALAGIAVERALAIDPGYTMAKLIAEGLRHLVAPEALRLRMPTSEQLDREMGPPKAQWLEPLRALLTEPAGSPGGAGPSGGGPPG